MGSYPLRRMLREHGHDEAVRVLTHVLVQAQIACGEPDNQKTAEIWASSLLSKFNHLSLETFILGIRDGLMTGKVYGKLNLPQIAEWMNELDARICGIAENEYAAQKESAGNLGGEYLDRLQHAADAPQRQLQRANSVIEELRRKLEVEQKKDRA